MWPIHNIYIFQNLVLNKYIQVYLCIYRWLLNTSIETDSNEILKSVVWKHFKSVTKKRMSYLFISTIRVEGLFAEPEQSGSEAKDVPQRQCSQHVWSPPLNHHYPPQHPTSPKPTLCAGRVSRTLEECKETSNCLQPKDLEALALPDQD